MKDLVLKTNGEYSRGLGAIKVFQIDWVLFLSAILISIAGLVTMNSFTGDNSYFENKPYGFQFQ